MNQSKLIQLNNIEPTAEEHAAQPTESLETRIHEPLTGNSELSPVVVDAEVDAVESEGSTALEPATLKNLLVEDTTTDVAPPPSIVVIEDGQVG